MFQPYFLHGHRFPSVINARLRNKCSDLNDDLFHKHVSDHNIYTNCLVPEITEYYLFHCNKYALSLSLSPSSLIFLRYIYIQFKHISTTFKEKL